MLRFLVLCAVLSWPLQIIALGAPTITLPLLALAGLGPTVAGTIVTRGAVWRGLRAAPPLGLLLVALLGPLGLVTVAAVADVALGGELVVGMPFIGALLLPPIGEELGWRGYLQPALAQRHGAIVAALGVGLAWAAWHVVPAAIAGAAGVDLAYLAVSILAWSILFAWLLERGGARLWLAVALHAGINAATLVGADTVQAALLRLAVVGVAALVAARALSRR